jgi:hypothetical protein
MAKRGNSEKSQIKIGKSLIKRREFTFEYGFVVRVEIRPLTPRTPSANCAPGPAAKPCLPIPGAGASWTSRLPLR